MSEHVPVKPSEERVKQAVDVADKASDRGRRGLEAWAQDFITAHRTAPDGLTIEVGTRIGGSALLWGMLLESMYGEENPPPLWTVDPYGGKPYVGGDVGELEVPIYGPDVYLAMKHNLVEAQYHAHFLMESHDFFGMRFAYWRLGDRRAQVVNAADGKPHELRVGESRRAGEGSASFILLDGEHSARAIVRDLRGAWPWLKTGGRVVIDNVDTDPKTMFEISCWLGGASIPYNAFHGSSTHLVPTQWLTLEKY